MIVTARHLADQLDVLLRTADFVDYPAAVNGLQLDRRGPVRRIGAAVDISLRVIEESARRGIDLLFVHHGMFWGGLQPITGVLYARLHLLFANDIAVYSSHLPLDAHPTLGNNVLLARALGLSPARPFAHGQDGAIGVAGDADLETAALLELADRFARERGGRAFATAAESGRRTLRWALCSGGGASSQILREAAASGVDTLIVGEGPHHTAVEAPEHGLTIIYAGHYATETLGVCAVARHLSEATGLEWEFIAAPTGT